MKNLSKKKITIILAIICAVQLFVSLYWVGQKNFLFFDEVFSFPAANGTLAMEFSENKWLDESWYLDYMTVDETDCFEYSIPYQNQVNDVHPPLFYMFLHTACSFIPGEFSFYAGTAFNVVFFLICAVALYFLGKELFGNKVCGVLAAFLYAVSYGGINTMVYIRMYMLLTLMIVLHAFVYLKYFDKEEIPAKGYVLFALTLLGGVLSQYYFLFAAFFFGVWYTIKFFAEKRYKVLGYYLTTIFATAACSLVIWPSMLRHLFGGGRGEEARGNLLSMEGYFSSVKEMFRILNNEMFTKMLPVILVALLVLLAICLKIGKEIDWNILKRATVIIFVCTGYLLLVAKVAPYMVDRYIMPLYPLVYMLVIGACYLLASKIIPKKLVGVLCTLGFLGLTVIHMLVSGIPYTYQKHPDNLERQAIVAEYKDNYALYISDNDGEHFYDAVQMLKEYQGFYYVYDLENIETVKKDMEVLSEEQKLLVYVKNKRTIEDANLFIQEVFTGCELNEHTLIDSDEKWNVYLLDINGVVE